MMLGCWQKLVIRGRSLPRITQLSNFHQLSLLVRWMGAKGTLPSRVDQVLLDSWTYRRRLLIETWKSVAPGGFHLPFRSGMEEFSLLVRWMGAKGTLPSLVDRVLLDSWTSRWRLLIETRKSVASRGFHLPFRSGMEEFSLLVRRIGHYEKIL